MFFITASNDDRKNKNTPSNTTEMAMVPTAVSVIAMLRAKFWPTSAQKKRTLPQSNMVASLLLVARDPAVDQPHHPAPHAVDDRLIVRGHDRRGALRVDARQQCHDLA